MIPDWLWAVVPPLGGWAWSVEKRLNKIDSIKESLDKVDSRTEKLVDHLIGTADVKTEHKGRS